MLSLPLLAPMLVMPFGVNVELPALWQWLLAAPCSLLPGRASGRVGRPAASGANMDVLVALGTSAAYGLSLWLWAQRAAATTSISSQRRW